MLNSESANSKSRREEDDDVDDIEEKKSAAIHSLNLCHFTDISQPGPGFIFGDRSR